MATNGTEAVTPNAHFVAFGISSIVICSISMIICTVGFSYVAAYRKRPVMMLSQLWFMFSFPFACFLLSLYALIWNLQNVWGILPCGWANLLLFPILGYIYSAMFCKEFFIIGLSNAARKFRKYDRNYRIYIIICVDVFLGGVLGSVQAYYAAQQITDPNEPYVCVSRHPKVMIGVSVLYIVANAISLLVVAFKGWKLTSIASENKVVLFLACYSIIILLLVTIPNVSGFAPHGLDSSEIGLGQAFLLLIFITVGMYGLIFRRIKWLNLTSLQVREMFLKRTNAKTTSSYATDATRLNYSETESRHSSSSGDSAPQGERNDELRAAMVFSQDQAKSKIDNTGEVECRELEIGQKEPSNRQDSRLAQTKDVSITVDSEENACSKDNATVVII